MDDRERELRSFQQAQRIAKRINSGKMIDFCTLMISSYIRFREDGLTPVVETMETAFNAVGINIQKYVK